MATANTSMVLSSASGSGVDACSPSPVVEALHERAVLQRVEAVFVQTLQHVVPGRFAGLPPSHQFTLPRPQVRSTRL